MNQGDPVPRGDTSPDELRRSILKVGSGVLAAGILSLPILGLTQSSSTHVQEGAPAPAVIQGINTVEQFIGEKQYSIDIGRNRSKVPLLDRRGRYFDLASRSYIPWYNLSRNQEKQRLLLSDSPVFDQEQWRDLRIDPSFILTDREFQKLQVGVDERLKIWLRDHDDSELLRVMQVANEVTEQLKYDRKAPVENRELPFADRLKAGYTNCLEYTITTASLLGVNGIPSEILYFSYINPETQQRTGHVVNIVNLFDRAAVVDPVLSDLRPFYLDDYFAQYDREGITVDKNMIVESILAKNSYEPFHWDDSEWFQHQGKPVLTSSSYILKQKPEEEKVGALFIDRNNK